jgi:hypothetical protein
MTRFAPTTCLLAASLLAVGLAASPCRAHFPWLATDAEGHALLFFGNNPQDRIYREELPEAVVKAKVTVAGAGVDAKEIELAALKTDEFVGRKSEAPAPKGGVLTSTISYGIYHGMLLDYYAKHLPSAEGSAAASGLKLDATPRIADGKVEVTVKWEGKPVDGASVTMTDAEGVPTEESTNAEGVAKFEAPGEGLIGFLVARTDDNAKGEVEGQKYTGAAAYGTVTVQLGDAATAPTAGTNTKSEAETVTTAANNAGLAPLPEALASFGGAVCDGYLYTYGGHIGEEHAHSRENLANHFRRLKLEEGSAWEELPMQLPLQGLPLVAHGGKLYRAGGLSFRNAAADEPDMHSVAEFACFDPKTNKWTALAPLPEPRSSHDAVVLGDTLYLVGGWTLSGESEGEWLTTAWSFDLTKPQGEWQSVASPPFKRRALAVARWDRQLVAIGGMDDSKPKPKISRRVDALDPIAGTWTKLPDLPRSEMAGFGVSAWNLEGQLLVSGADGVVHKLTDDGSKWEQVGNLATGRFFHRLLPGADSTLLVVAGASMDAGHLPSIERFKPGQPASN